MNNEIETYSKLHRHLTTQNS